MTRESGAVLIFAMVIIIVMAGMIGAVTMSSVSAHRASSDSLDNEMAYFAAESGVSYYLIVLSTDPFVFDKDPAPHGWRSLGGASFKLERATPLVEGWELVVTGFHNQRRARVSAAIGYRQLRNPGGLIIGGDMGDADGLKLTVSGESYIGSFNPNDGPFDPDNLNSNSWVQVNGSVDVNGGSGIMGDLDATGEIVWGGNTELDGVATEEADPVEVQNIDGLVDSLMAETAAQSNNSVLPGIFNSQYSKVDNTSGDLILDGGTYVVPPGNYVFRSLELRNGAQLVFDTSGGNTSVSFLGGGDTNRIILDEASQLLVDPGDTENQLRVLLNETTSMSLNAESVFGQAVGKGDSASYTQLFAKSSDAKHSPDIRVMSHSRAYGDLKAPDYELVLGGQARWFGTGLIDELTLNGSQSGPAAFVVDEELQNASLTDPTQFRVNARWLSPAYESEADPLAKPQFVDETTTKTSSI